VNEVEIGDRILQVLQIKGIKQAGLARMLQISESAVSNMCKGKSKPSTQSITLICERFGIREEWLRTGKGEMQAASCAEISNIASQLRQLDSDSERYQVAIEAVQYVLQLSEDQAEIFGDILGNLKALKHATS
jgi:transcriptional regulator with XRE-family HTH domain